MPLTAQGSALVAGGNAGGGRAAPLSVVVVRAFCLGGVRQEPGSVVELPPVLGRELIALGKAALVEDVPTPTSESSEPAEPVRSSKKGKSNAR